LEKGVRGIEVVIRCKKASFFHELILIRKAE